MTVKDLILELQKLPPDAKIFHQCPQECHYGYQGEINNIVRTTDVDDKEVFVII